MSHQAQDEQNNSVGPMLALRQIPDSHYLSVNLQKTCKYADFHSMQACWAREWAFPCRKLATNENPFASCCKFVASMLQEYGFSFDAILQVSCKPQVWLKSTACTQVAVWEWEFGTGVTFAWKKAGNRSWLSSCISNLPNKFITVKTKFSTATNHLLVIPSF